MRKIEIHQVDAFTDKIFGGNPAAVVFAADVLTEEEMKNIAREMNLSETAFVLRPKKKKASIKLRFFTSEKAEIKFCGHTTIATLYALAKEERFGMNKEGTFTLQVETNAGVLSMTVRK